MLAKGIKIYLKKGKTKNINMLVKGIKIFLKKKKTENKTACRESYKNLSEEEKYKLVDTEELVRESLRNNCKVPQ